MKTVQKVKEVTKEEIISGKDKPDAKFNPVKSLHQIYLYKLALSKRTGIPLELVLKFDIQLITGLPVDG